MDLDTFPSQNVSKQKPGTAKRRRETTSSHEGRRVRKITRACDACKVSSSGDVRGNRWAICQASCSPLADNHSSLETQTADQIQVKKARCSGERPCLFCANKGVACLYESQYLRGKAPTPPYSGPRETPDLSIGNDDTVHGISMVMPPSLETDVTQTSSRIYDNPVLSASRSRSPADLESAEIHGQYVDPTSSLSFLQRARHRLAVRRTRIDGQSNHSHLQPLATAGDKPLLDKQSSPGAETALPGSQEIDELLSLYFDVCIATYKPLHRPTVRSWLQSALENADCGREQDHNIGKARLSMCYGVLAAATFHRQKSRGFEDDDGSLSASDAYFKESSRLTESETGVPHLESAQARLVQVFYLLMTCRMNQAWYIFGSLLQIVSALGMHRKDGKTLAPNRKTDYIHRQCRRRAFWTTYILDKYLGVVMGRPRHFHDFDIDQDYPDSVNDDEMSGTGRVESSDLEDCSIDAFIQNIKLSRIVGSISRELYPIQPLTESVRLERTRHFAEELRQWHSALPAFLGSVKPSTLVRSFRRQAVAIRLAYYHAKMHLYRPFLFKHTTSRSSHTIQRFHEESAIECLAASEQALRLVDTLAKEGTIFHAYWWTHYVTFCALSIAYVSDIQQRHRPAAVARPPNDSLILLAEKCHKHLGQATATNTPTRRYSIILDELRAETRHPLGGSDPRVSAAPVAGSSSETHVAAESRNGADTQLNSGDLGIGLEETSLVDPFEDWQISDWLDLDASVSTC